MDVLLLPVFRFNAPGTQLGESLDLQITGCETRRADRHRLTRRLGDSRRAAPAEGDPYRTSDLRQDDIAVELVAAARIIGENDPLRRIIIDVDIAVINIGGIGRQNRNIRCPAD